MSVLENSSRITPFLWFDSNAEEAVDFYLTVFKNSRRLDECAMTNRVPNGGILTIAFELDGQKFTALNGGPNFKFTEAVSFVVRCDSQQEVDDYWSKLSAGGSENGVDGSRISSASPGRSCPRACPASSKTRRRCRPCFG